MRRTPLLALLLVAALGDQQHRDLAEQQRRACLPRCPRCNEPAEPDHACEPGPGSLDGALDRILDADPKGWPALTGIPGDD